MWENSLDQGWTAEERNILDQAVEFTIHNERNPDFFELAAVLLTEISASDFTLISALYPKDQFGIQTLAIASQGELQMHLAGILDGSPYEQVFGSKFCSFPFQVQKHFPANSILKTLSIENYIGVTLHDENNDPIGLLVLMQGQPFLKVAFLEALLGIFSLPLEKIIRKLLAVQADI
jgi:hypothetical protein